MRAPDRHGPLFVYGTLLVPAVLRRLLGRVPTGVDAVAPGWRAVALVGRVYPGLVPAPGDAAAGRVLTDLAPPEWDIVDRYEDAEYAVRRIVLADGATAWAYVWTDATTVTPTHWNLASFVDADLPAFLEHLP